MARDFDGTDDWLDFGDTTIMDGLTELSAGGWFFIDTTPAGGSNVSVLRKDGTATPVQLNGSDGKWNCVLWSSGIKIFNGPTFATIGTGAWVHLMATWTTGDGDVDFYINGALSVTTAGTAASGLDLTANVLRFGATEGGGEDYNGRMAEIAFWNRELTAGEVALMGADSYCPLFVPRGLILYTPLVRELTNRVGASPTANGTSVLEHPRVIYPGKQQSFKPPSAAPATAVKDLISAGIIAFAR